MFHNFKVFTIFFNIIEKIKRITNFSLSLKKIEIIRNTVSGFLVHTGLEHRFFVHAGLLKGCQIFCTN
ncbi:unnamed protein product [Rhizophagus irregularis]|uniref:Uncharacterized protein n=1 Tax=Rhizophagus irregularis TaxID=588596 RepID=A0A915ZSQ8_9GLOM|nr:unnamed protein product [Rhizophagus irregularis]